MTSKRPSKMCLALSWIFWSPPRLQGLSDKLPGRAADIFHFAGHGGFKQTGLGGEIGSILGQGEIFLVDAAGRGRTLAGRPTGGEPAGPWGPIGSPAPVRPDGGMGRTSGAG